MPVCLRLGATRHTGEEKMKKVLAITAAICVAFCPGPECAGRAVIEYTVADLGTLGWAA